MKTIVYLTFSIIALVINGDRCHVDPQNFSQEIPRTLVVEGNSKTFSYVTPFEVGMPQDYVSFIGDEVASWVANNEINGAEILLLKGNQIFYHEVIGWKDVQNQIPLKPNAIYAIASMTKSYTGTAILQLIDQGKLSLDDAVNNYIAGFPKDVTIQHVLSMRSGYAGADPIGDTVIVTLEDAVNHLVSSKERVPLGTYRYTDLNTIFLGYILEKITGSTIQDYIQTNILDPLDLDHTYLDMSLESSLGNAVMPIYSWDYNKLGVTKRWEFGPRKRPGSKPFWDPSGDLQATITDYAKFMRTWMQGGRWDDTRILSEKLVSAAIKPQGSDTYGYCWQILANSIDADNSNYFGHGGTYGTNAVAFPEEDIIAIYFTQTARSLATKKIEQIFASPELVGNPRFYPKNINDMGVTIDSTLDPYLKNLTGTYATYRDNKLTGEMATVNIKDGHLYFKIGEPAVLSGPEFHLIPTLKDSFVAGIKDDHGIFINDQFVVTVTSQNNLNSITLTFEDQIRFQGRKIALDSALTYISSVKLKN